MPDTAVIVAAGLSSRLYPLTRETPKGLLPIGGETLLGRSVRLLRLAGISRIAVVVGFRADDIRGSLGESVTTIANPFYRQCNNMGSLLAARHFAGNDPFVYLHGDLVYTGRMLDSFLEASATGESCLDLLTVFGEVDDEAMKVRVDERTLLVESNKSIPLEDAAGEWTGIAVVRDPQLVFGGIESHMMSVSLTDYDTAAFSSLAAAGHVVRCLPSVGDPWKEIDTLDDLESARAAFGGNA